MLDKASFITVRQVNTMRSKLRWELGNFRILFCSGILKEFRARDSAFYSRGVILGWRSKLIFNKCSFS